MNRVVLGDRWVDRRREVRIVTDLSDDADTPADHGPDACTTHSASHDVARDRSGLSSRSLIESPITAEFDPNLVERLSVTVLGDDAIHAALGDVPE